MEQATEKQLSFMKSLGISIPTPCTKEIAKQMISYNLENQEKKEDKVEVVDMSKKVKPKNDKEYHAAIETCRMKALECSIETLKDKSVGEIKQLTKEYFNWIWRGE